MPRPKATRKKLARRACDSCKVRKIRCTEVAPCSGCVATGIECTFTGVQAQRGPRGLRPGTIENIKLHKQQKEAPSVRNPQGGDAPDAARDIAHLSAIINIYASRLFPVWPIIDTSKLMLNLLITPNHHSSFRLANAVALATVAQLKLDTPWQPDLEQIRRSDGSETGDLLDNLRISFFLHIYHENQVAGGTQSLLFLREAITQAQILRLDHESSYSSLPDSEQQTCRRVFWLLFVTERGVALLHKLPPVLKPNILFPGNDATEGCSHILPAFLKLVHLFWIFDHSGIFEILQDGESNSMQAGNLVRSCLEILQQRLQESVSDDEWGTGNDVQRADVLLTRQWMRAILSRAAFKLGIENPAVDPVNIAREFISLVSRIPLAALESHGATLEFKTFEIATTVIDAMTRNYSGISVDVTADILFSLRAILSSSRGGNTKLLLLLNTRLHDTFGSADVLLQSPRLHYQYEESTVDGGDPGPWLYENVVAPSPLTTPFLVLAPSTGEDEYCAASPDRDLANLSRSMSPFTRLLVDINSQSLQDESFATSAEESGVLTG